MKNLFINLFLGFLTFILLLSPKAYADDSATVLNLFNNYVTAANNHSSSILNMYSPKAKIIRQVVKPNGATVNVTTNMKTYAHQMVVSESIAKINRYTNKYSNINVAKVSNGYKVTALRQPMKNSYWLKTYQIWQQQPNGKWLIIEEMMQTKEQIFLKYADKK